ncbi:MAG TPA: TIGR02266 family protein [Candidatus Methylomirabilis sp.]|jgi:type IV pilus assembly protein PilZ
MRERRGEPRVEVDVEVHYRTAQEFVSAYARNVSGGGIFVRTQHPLALNQVVRVRFTLPGITHKFECNGTVVWANPPSSRSALPAGMGIKLEDLDPEARTLLSDFVRTMTPAPTPDQRS